MQRDAKHGSSPRVRGTVVRERPPVHLERFIPACAGNSFRDIIEHFIGAVHPRVCGEQYTCRVWTFPASGSSPRVRGTGDRIDPATQCQRFIPACAGNRSSATLIRPVIAVHPRVCGEQLQDQADSVQQFGSSPRVRGTVFQRVAQGGFQRFIPACAGNSEGTAAQDTGHSVHPRVCGEQLVSSACCSSKVGSSPRVRGTVSPGKGK